MDARAVAVAFGIAALSTVVFALVPMLKLAGTDPVRVLQASGAGAHSAAEDSAGFASRCQPLRSGFRCSCSFSPRYSRKASALGIPLGLAAALGLGRLAESLLYDLEATNVAALTAALAILLVVVLGASYLPARRASRVDPVIALRAE